MRPWCPDPYPRYGCGQECSSRALTLLNRGSVPGLRGHTEWPADVFVSRVHFCLSQEIEDLRMAMSAMPVEESVQMSAWALKSTGVDVGRPIALHWAPA